MRPEKEDIEKRKVELQKRHDDIAEKINQARDAIRNMETTFIGLQGAIQQCDWTLSLYKEEKAK